MHGSLRIEVEGPPGSVLLAGCALSRAVDVLAQMGAGGRRRGEHDRAGHEPTVHPATELNGRAAALLLLRVCAALESAASVTPADLEAALHIFACLSGGAA